MEDREQMPEGASVSEEACFEGRDVSLVTQTRAECFSGNFAALYRPSTSTSLILFTLINSVKRVFR